MLIDYEMIRLFDGKVWLNKNDFTFFQFWGFSLKNLFLFGRSSVEDSRDDVGWHQVNRCVWSRKGKFINKFSDVHIFLFNFRQSWKLTCLTGYIK